MNDEDANTDLLRYLKFLFVMGTVVISAAAIGPSKTRKPMEESFIYIKSKTHEFTLSVHQLKRAISQINVSDKSSIRPVITALKSCRIQYKKISFFLDYFYPQQGKLFNAPAKQEIEEPDLETEEPQSLQQIESILYSSNPQLKKEALKNLVLVLDESAAGLTSLYAGFQADEAQMLESLHLELIRVMALYITGYDAPDLKTGIKESAAALESMQKLTEVLFNFSNPEAIRLDSLFTASIRYTRSAGFDDFDRLQFLKQYALPIEEKLEQCIEINDWQLSTVPELSYESGNLFRKELIRSKESLSTSTVSIGRSLFFEKALSGNNSRSCATCHQPDKYFSDGLVANQKMNSHSLLRRNTPTLLYSSCQSTQFWDGRAASISDQIAAVLNSPDEMNASTPEVENRLSKIAYYRNAFGDSVNLKHIQDALTAYLQTLQPMNSSFDQYLKGDESAFTVQQKRGFNLFMGKAQCGTCHFAPVFNGSTPPFFNRSEYEVLGVPDMKSSRIALPDQDLGRYELYPIGYYKRAFKTPTVRNVGRTAPYMHNGSMKDLQSVLNFYNRGGGSGIGLVSQEQTLSRKNLHLSKREMADIIAFLGALTDTMTAIR